MRNTVSAPLVLWVSLIQNCIYPMKMLNIDRPYSISRETTIEVMVVRFSQNRGYLKALRDPLRLPTSVIENETEETFSSVSRLICSLSKDTVSAAVVEVYTQNSSLECFFDCFQRFFGCF